MNYELINHEIVIVTYNQESTILYALLSAINQTIKPQKISIFDDCSTDQTVSIIKNELSKICTDINIHIHVNPVNLGIFQNSNNILSYLTGDVVHFLAGDDEVELDLIENYNKYIKEQKVDLTKPVWLIPNITEFYQNGNKRKKDQHTYTKYSLFEAILANKIRSFEVGLSLPAAKQLYTETDIGYQADNLRSLLLCKSIDVRLVDFYAYKYRTSTGVTTNTDRNSLLNSRQTVLTLLLTKYVNFLTTREIIIIKYELSIVKYILKPCIYTYFSLIKHLISILFIGNTVYDKKILLNIIPIRLKNIIKSLFYKGKCLK